MSFFLYIIDQKYSAGSGVIDRAGGCPIRKGDSVPNDLVSFIFTDNDSGFLSFIHAEQRHSDSTGFENSH